MSSGQEFTADAKALEYLQPLGYSVEDYTAALQFLASHGYAERTGGVLTNQKGFSLRMAVLRNRYKPRPPTTQTPDES